LNWTNQKKIEGTPKKNQNIIHLVRQESTYGRRKTSTVMQNQTKKSFNSANYQKKIKPVSSNEKKDDFYDKKKQPSSLLNPL
jgi:hypothetical protein